MRQRSVTVETRGRHVFRLKWRHDGVQQSHTVRSKVDANAARLAIESLGCNIAGDDVRVRTGSLWRGEVRASASVLTFGDAARSMLATRKEATAERYRRELRRPALAQWDRVEVGAITQAQVATWMNAQSKTGTPRTVRYRAKLLGMVLRHAQQSGWRADNPLRNVDLPEVVARDAVHPLSVAQVEAVKAATADPVVRILWHVLARSGLRVGEALALRVEHVNLDSGHVLVRGALTGDRRGIGNGKSRHAFRDVIVDGETLALLRPLVVGRPASAWVFHRPDGAAWSYNGVAGYWRRVRVAAGLPDGTRIHDLRHSHATWLLNDNVPPLVVSRRLGHGSITVTHDLYGHVDPAGDAAVLASMSGRAAGTTLTPIRKRRTA